MVELDVVHPDAVVLVVDMVLVLELVELVVLDEVVLL